MLPIHTFIFCLLLVAAGVLLPAKGNAAPPAANRAMVDKVAGLRAFIIESYPGDPTVFAWSVDLDLPPDQVDEIILHFEDIGYCGSGGCEWAILRREPSGKLVSIATILAGDVYLKRAPAQNRQRVFAVTRNGHIELPMAGQSSAQIKRTRQAHATHQRKPGHLEGPCLEGFFWSGGPSQGSSSNQANSQTNSQGNRLSSGLPTGGEAIYASCISGKSTVAMACEGASAKVKLTVKISAGGYKPGEDIPALLSVVRGQETLFHPKSGSLSHSDADGAIVTVSFDLGDPFLDDLKMGSSAMINAALSKIDLHLKGSAKAVSAMTKACEAAAKGLYTKDRRK